MFTSKSFANTNSIHRISFSHSNYIQAIKMTLRHGHRMSRTGKVDVSWVRRALIDDRKKMQCKCSVILLKTVFGLPLV